MNKKSSTSELPKIARAAFLPEHARQFLESIEVGALDVQMYASDATARELVASKDGLFGADLLRFPDNGMVPRHTHPGSHILIVVAGRGKLLAGIEIIELYPGLIYFVPPDHPHEIQSTHELTLISIGDKRRLPESPERLSLC